MILCADDLVSVPLTQCSKSDAAHRKHFRDLKMPTRYSARHDFIEVTFLWERRCLNDGFRTFGAVTTDDMLSCAGAP